MSCPDINWVEFENDFQSREFLQGVINRLKSLVNGLENNKIMHDYDNYKDALDDYDYSKYKASKGATGYQVKVDEMGQFFTKSSATPATDTPATDLPG